MKLYEISEEYRELLSLVDSEELTADMVADTLDAMDSEFENKARQCVAVLKEIEGAAMVAKNEADRLLNLAKSYNNSADRMKDYIRSNMEATNKEKLDLGIFKLTLKKPTQIVFVEDEAKVPDDYWRVIPETRQIDKRALLEALKNGPINGAHVADGKRALLIK